MVPGPAYSGLWDGALFACVGFSEEVQWPVGTFTMRTVGPVATPQSDKIKG